VPVQWLREGCLLDVALPRNLVCAQCHGGGCDACGRSGAVSIRERRATEEPLRVSIPAQAEADGETHFILRIPERGGHAPEESGHPRGLLLLTVAAGSAPSPQVLRVPTPGRDAIVEAPAHPTLHPWKWLALALLAALALLLAWLAGT